MRHPKQQSGRRSQEHRRRLAVEAARLMAEGGIRDFGLAKRKAASRLGLQDDQALLPANHEIEAALREHQRLFAAQSQAQALRQRREAAVEAMRYFADFDPRLVGAVLDGSADAHSAICLHLFADEPEAVARFLHEHRVPAQERSRRLRLDRERSAEFPVWLFSAEGLALDVTVLPPALLRQAPLDRCDDKPMRRASLVAVETLLEREAAAQREPTGT